MNATTDFGSRNRPSGTAGTAQLEREGDELRADMDRTLEEIERELSPSKLIDRSKEFVRTHGSDFVREAGEVVRANPIPVLLAAAGIVWLTAAVASPRSGRRSSRNGDGAHLDEDMESFDEFAAGQGYAQGSASGRLAASRLAEKGNRLASKGKSQLTQLVREQPVALGALALAAGALLGAALPMTEYENKLMGAIGSDPLSLGGGGSESQDQQTSPTMMDE